MQEESDLPKVWDDNFQFPEMNTNVISFGEKNQASM